jgi:glycosyltransferase involved in cell wall biosynthesis
VAALLRDGIDAVVVADGGSSDATPERAQKAGAQVIAVGRGYGLACLAGAQAAHDADIVVYMDGDGADDPAAIAALVAPIANGDCDFVIASRARGKRQPGSMAWHQLLAGRVIGGLIGWFYGARYTDMCALRAIRRDALLRLGMREMTYGWNLEMQMRAARAQLRIREVPVDYRCRIGGQSKVAGSLSGSLKAGARILSTFARIALERQ